MERDVPFQAAASHVKPFVFPLLDIHGRAPRPREAFIPHPLGPRPQNWSPPQFCAAGKDWLPHPWLILTFIVVNSLFSLHIYIYILNIY